MGVDGRLGETEDAVECAVGFFIEASTEGFNGGGEETVIGGVGGEERQAGFESGEGR